MSSKILLTKSGFEGIKKEISSLEGFIESKNNQKVKELYGSLDGAKARLAELKNVAENARVITVSESEMNYVQFGCSVVLGDIETGSELSVRIVGEFEADEKNGFFSTESELGRALIGKAIGQSIKVKRGKDFKEYEVIEISC